MKWSASHPTWGTARRALLRVAFVTFVVTLAVVGVGALLFALVLAAAVEAVRRT